MRDRVRELLSCRQAPLARRGLETLYLPEQALFCNRAVIGPDGGVRREGCSLYYSAMALVGLAAQAQRQAATLPLTEIASRLAGWAMTAPKVEEAGLVLWGLSLLGHDRAPELARALVARRAEALDERRGLAAMELGWLLAGVATALRSGVCGPPLEDLGRGLANRLLACCREPAGLFSFGPGYPRRNLHALRIERRLGSFASQVYAVVGLLLHREWSGDRAAGEAALRALRAMVAAQGPEGQWWWIYAAGSGRVVVRYPLFLVHQDGMGPMALLAGIRASGWEGWLEPLARSLAWLDVHPEDRTASLWDEGRGLIWRSLQRDARPPGKLDLGWQDRLRFHLAAWSGRADRTPLRQGFLSQECRPYHLGWVLLAEAWLAEACEREGGPS